ncbi:chorismate-binding protein, partial [bacterium]|nr:chorismate-binding protein [bacterium]
MAELDPRAPNTVVLHDASRGVWLWFQEPVAVCVAHGPAEVRPVLETVARRVETEGVHAAGFVSYEAAPAFDPALAVRPASGFPLLWFGLYRAPAVGPAPSADRGELPRLDWEPSVTGPAYRAAIRRVKDYIAAGDTYQVNYTIRLRAGFGGDPWSLFGTLVRRQVPG